MTTKPPSDRARLRRVHERGQYDRDSIDAVLDAGLLCHVGYVADGLPYVTPTLHWRIDDKVYWHGSSASRALRAGESAEVCLTVSFLDGLVLARSGFHHSVNYRSAMVFGKAQIVDDAEEKTRVLDNLIDRIAPGRVAEIRRPTDQELKATTVLWLPLDNASAKVRNGPPVDDEEDYALPVWAGILPVTGQVGAPIADPRLTAGIDPPAYLAHSAKLLSGEGA